MGKRRIWIILCCIPLLAGCTLPPVSTEPTAGTSPGTAQATQPVIATDPTVPSATVPVSPTDPMPTDPPVTDPRPTEPLPTDPPPTEPQPTDPPPTEPQPTDPEPEKKLIVIDAGHQSKGNYDKEPNGPGSDILKAKVTSGTEGVSTGLEEYKLNLAVALKLQAVLEARGYDVVMVRTTHDVDISNAERAAVANDLKADAFIRIHANGSDDPDTNGILTICQTPENPFNGELYDACKALSTRVLDEMCAATGAKRLYVWETDTMSGINWCQVPVTIVEMGFMSCPWEDELMSTEEYQQKIAEGIANGIDAYFGT